MEHLENLMPFYQRLDLALDADERTIKRAYARELKLIDQETDLAGFQELRTAYEGALSWLRHLAQMERDDESGAEHIAVVPLAARAGAWQTVEDESSAIDPERVAQEVFSDFQRACAQFADDSSCAHAWQGALRASLADERLINLGARHDFEQRIAEYLAQGWQPGSHLLLVAAISEMQWNLDRRRLFAFDGAGYVINAAIEQQAISEAQAEDQRALQRELLERLRQSQPPSTGELIRMTPTLAAMELRFPALLALLAPASHVQRWHELDGAIPQWRRLRPPKLSLGWCLCIAFACLMVFVGSSIYLTGGYSAANRHLAAARPLLDANDFNGALSHLDRAVRADLQNPAACAARAMALIAIGDFRRAQLDLATLERLDKAHPDLFLGRGIIAHTAGDYPAALAAFTRSLELLPYNAETRLWRALAFESLGQLDEALAGADASLQRDPGSMGAFLLRARVFHARHDTARLLAEARAVVASNGHRDEAYMAAAEMHTMRGDPVQARAVLAQGIEQAPSAALYLLHAEARPFADLAGRRKDIDSAQKLAPDHPKCLLMRVQLELDAGQYEAALAAATAALEKESPRHSRIALFAGRGVAYEKQGKSDEAMNEFKIATTMASGGPNLNNLCWQLAINQVALPTALAICNQSIERLPNEASSLDSKGFVLLQMKRYKEAIASYDAGIALRPNSPESLYGRGIAKHRLGNARGGKADMDAALALRPKMGEFFERFKLVP